MIVWLKGFFLLKKNATRLWESIQDTNLGALLISPSALKYETSTM
jgi:hypothetical protein